MSTITAEKVTTLSGCFGTYPQTQALKSGAIERAVAVAASFGEQAA